MNCGSEMVGTWESKGSIDSYFLEVIGGRATSLV